MLLTYGNISVSIDRRSDRLMHLEKNFAILIVWKERGLVSNTAVIVRTIVAYVILSYTNRTKMKRTILLDAIH